MNAPPHPSLPRRPARTSQREPERAPRPPARTSTTASQVEEFSAVRLDADTTRTIAILTRPGDAACLAVSRFSKGACLGAIRIRAPHAAAVLLVVEAALEGRTTPPCSVPDRGGAWSVVATSTGRAVVLALALDGSTRGRPTTLAGVELDAFARAARALALTFDARATVARSSLT